tara:strand:+ start:2958 stop:3575 length:618 start_codon:yes stop_codon:yes gene_type:complete
MEDYKPKKWIIGDKTKVTAHIRARSKSNLVSYDIVNKLRKEYEKENNINYDCIIMTRFDLIIQLDCDLTKLDMTRFWTPATYKPNQANWDLQFLKDNIYCYEWILVSNGENFDEFCRLAEVWDDNAKKTGNYIRKEGKGRNTNNPHHMLAYYFVHNSKLADKFDMIPIKDMKTCSGNCVGRINGKRDLNALKKQFPVFKDLKIPN